MATCRETAAGLVLLAACAPAVPPAPVVKVDLDPCDVEVARANRGEPERQGDGPVCEARCRAGDATACVVVGLIGGFHPCIISVGYVAAWHFENACAAGVAVGCTHAGEAALTSSQPQEITARLFEKGCEGGDQEGCHLLGLVLAGAVDLWCKYQRSRVEDAPRAEALLGGACGAGHDQSCHDLGRLLSEGRALGKDEARAADLFERACDAEVAEACAALGEALAEGRGVERDQAAAAAAFSRACSLGHAGSCAAAHPRR